jgi:D-serine deaminase-like pyridoxal phosphate-dependent protein
MLRNQGIQVNHQGIGSTPSCSQNVSSNASYDTLTEIHPGNYVFYDQMQKIVSGIKGSFQIKKGLEMLILALK